LLDIVLSKQEGDTLELRVLRDGEEQNVAVTLGVVPRDEQTADTGESEPQSQSETPPSGPRLGVAVQDVGAYPDDVRQSLNLPEGGVVVTEVAPDSPAAAAGLRGGQFALDFEGKQYAAGGDVILAVDGEEVESAEALQQLISSRQAGDTLELRIWRNGEEQTLNATLAEATPNN
ncbi:MAG TPA: PDZ domain-containing protein, partial [Chloroflexota bacterium]|nr:PDZ domain-containing protein [Chloroflexota bacterium]